MQEWGPFPGGEYIQAPSAEAAYAIWKGRQGGAPPPPPPPPGTGTGRGGQGTPLGFSNAGAVLQDAAKSVGSGLLGGAFQAAGALGDIQTGFEGAGDWVHDRIRDMKGQPPLTPEQRAQEKAAMNQPLNVGGVDIPGTGIGARGLPTTNEMVGGATDATGIDFEGAVNYEPETEIGGVLKTAGQFAAPLPFGGTANAARGAFSAATRKALVDKTAMPSFANPMTRGQEVRRTASNTLKYGAAPGAASEIAGDKTEGTWAEPYARTVAALTTPGALTASTWLFKSRNPDFRKLNDTAEAWKNLSQGKYQEFDKSGVMISPLATQAMTQAVRTDLSRNGWDEFVASEYPHVQKALEKLDELANQGPSSITRLDAVRQMLRDAFSSSAGIPDKPSEMRFATIASQAFDRGINALTKNDLVAAPGPSLSAAATGATPPAAQAVKDAEQRLQKLSRVFKNSRDPQVQADIDTLRQAGYPVDRNDLTIKMAIGVGPSKPNAAITPQNTAGHIPPDHPQKAINQLNQARSTWQTYAVMRDKAKILTDMWDKAQNNSAGNSIGFEGNLRRQFINLSNKMLDKPDIARLFTADEKALIREIIHPGKGPAFLRSLGAGAPVSWWRGGASMGLPSLATYFLTRSGATAAGVGIGMAGASGVARGMSNRVMREQFDKLLKTTTNKGKVPPLVPQRQMNPLLEAWYANQGFNRPFED